MIGRASRQSKALEGVLPIIVASAQYLVPSPTGQFSALECGEKLVMFRR